MTSAAVSATPLRVVRPAPAPLSIEVAGVTKHFGERAALSGVTLGVEPGQIHALLGPNGAGKTTLLRILSGLVTPDAGSVHLNGLEPRTPRATSSWASSRPATVPSTSGSRRSRTSSSSAACTACDGGTPSSAPAPVSRRSGSQPRSASAPGCSRRACSGGWRSRRALICDPAILLVDEATHDLDPEGARRVRALVARAAAERSIAVLWTTQRLEEIAGFADRVTLLDVGRTRFCGSVDDLIAHSLVRRYVLTMPTAERDREEVARRAGAAVLGRAEIAIVPVGRRPLRARAARATRCSATRSRR